MRPRKSRGPRHFIFYILYFMSALVGFTSCDLEFEVDSELLKIAAEMSLNYDTVYVMQGDTIALQPKFKPDTLNIKDIYVRSSNYDVVNVNILNGRIEAVGTGWARLFVESVSARLMDSCDVCVMVPWETTAQMEYPYETIFYADITVQGKPLTEDMIVGAFVGEECRGIAQPLTFHGVSLMQLRVGAENVYDDSSIPDIPDIDSSGDAGLPDPEEDENDGDDDENDNSGGPLLPEEGVENTTDIYQEVITFRCYDKKTLRLYESLVTVDFDGETHGTLSKLFKIEF